MEKFDIYNAQKQKIGTGHPRGVPLPKGQYRFLATVIVYNAAGELLMQQRVASKKSWSSYWTPGASGAVIAGETVAEGASRELLEELGIAHDFSNTPSRLSVSFAEGWDEIWLLEWNGDLSELTLQVEEVSAARWVTRDQYFQLLENGQAIPHIYAREIFQWIRSKDEYLVEE